MMLLKVCDGRAKVHAVEQVACQSFYIATGYFRESRESCGPALAPAMAIDAEAAAGYFCEGNELAPLGGCVGALGGVHSQPDFVG